MGFEVAYDPCENIKLVKAIKKHAVLYNYKLYPPVEYKDRMEKTWAIVALELGLSEGHCKTRWTNIKGCYKRYLRNKARNASTKHYYLARYLDYMRPFTRVSRKGERDFETDYDISNFSSELEVKLVDSDGEEESYFIETSPNPGNIEDYTEDVETKGNTDWHFFSSLLPDIEKMNPIQKSKFKNAVLSAIDMTLYGEDM